MREIVVFLAATSLLVPVLQRLKLSPVLGFLFVGMLIGPFGLGLHAQDWPILHWVVISDVEGVRTLAELGIVFLLFTIGLELSFDRIWRMRRDVFGLGGAQVILTGIAIAGVCSALGLGAPESVTIGAALALSSTAIVMQILTEQRRLASAVGRTGFSILLLQDLAVVPVLFLVGALGAGGEGGNIAGAFGLALLKAGAAVAVIIVAGRLVVRPLFRFVGATKSPEIFMAMTLLMVLGIAGATAAAGLSMAMGAFLAGLLLSETEFRHQIDVDIAPFKGLLLGLFFMSVGMGIDVRVIGGAAVPLLAAVVGLCLLKATIIGALAWAFRHPKSVALETGLLLGQGGEFAFVIVTIALALGVMSEGTAQFVFFVTSLSMLATPFVAQLARRIGQKMSERESQAAHSNELAQLGDIKGHIIVAGYGRVGTLLADVLERQNLMSVGLDLDAVAVAKRRAEGRQVFYGDAARAEILSRAGAESAQALVVTMDNARAVEEVVAHVHRAWPDLPIYARARDVPHARELLRLGATKAIPENLEASIQLAQETLEGVGIPTEAAWRLCESLRASEYLDQLPEQAENAAVSPETKNP